MLPDFVNGCFELFGSVAVWRNAYALYQDKCYRGIRVLPFVFFVSWSIWNLYYYPHLNQWMSFIGGVSILLANAVNLSLMLYYGKGE